MQVENIRLHKRKSDTLIYLCSYEGNPCILKSIIAKDDALKQAFCDEYSSISNLSHPCIPGYLWFDGDFTFPESDTSTAVLCIEDCRHIGSRTVSLEEILSGNDTMDPAMLPAIFCDLMDVLSYLLKNGVLYTDLNPANILLHIDADRITLHLIDYTCCYYFKANPHPSYHIRFSYDLNPDLSGRSMLIQEVSLLLAELVPVLYQDGTIPFALIAALETGKNPPEHLSLEDFTQMLVHALHNGHQ